MGGGGGGGGGGEGGAFFSCKVGKTKRCFVLFAKSAIFLLWS